MIYERETHLFPTTSKFSINITRSRYQFCFRFLGFVGFGLIVLFQFSFLARAEIYLLVLAILVASIILIGVMNSAKHATPYLTSLLLTKEGAVSFSNDPIDYQLLANSRISFLGCWLIISPRLNREIKTNIGQERSLITGNNNKVQKVFIFRDSLSGQDYSRLSNVLNNLT
tara:strand:- start:505 stop:1017 length:513 start_codon:yes stop_codon:yes gene_type:complete